MVVGLPAVRGVRYNMCNPNLKEVRKRLVDEGKISPEESEEIRSRASWLCNFIGWACLVVGIVIGYAIWGIPHA